MHITASVYIKDAEDGLLHDYDVWLEKLAPHAPTEQYQIASCVHHRHPERAIPVGVYEVRVSAFPQEFVHNRRVISLRCEVQSGPAIVVLRID